MRAFKLNAALLALIFSVIAEVLFLVINRAFGEVTQFGSPLNFIGWFGLWFHVLPDAYLPSKFAETILVIPAWLLQWWIIFFPAIVFARYIARQNNPKPLKLIICGLTFGFILSVGFLFHSQAWENLNLKAEVGYLANIQGCEKAANDFNAGKLKKLIIVGECQEDKFSGTNDGPYEVWIAEYYPLLPWPNRYSLEEKIKAYNSTMRRKYQWSLTHTNSVKLPSAP